MPNRPDHTVSRSCRGPSRTCAWRSHGRLRPASTPAALIDLPMENVHGRFVFDDGKVTMTDVNFMFRALP